MGNCWLTFWMRKESQGKEKEGERWSRGGGVAGLTSECQFCMRFATCFFSTPSHCNTLLFTYMHTLIERETL